MIIDLHSHTTESDGKLSPRELIMRAQTRQINVLAITDHDSIDALEPAQHAIDELGTNLQLINGVEISTSWHNFEIHVLGLNLTLTDELRAQLAEQQLRRQERGEKIAAKLEKAGFVGALEGAKTYAKGASLSRVHFARWLMELGVVDKMQKAFDKYLGRGERAYVKTDWVSMEQGIEWIQAAGGSAVLAHPARYDLSNKWVRKLVNEFSLANGDGMEVVHSQQSPDERRFLATLSVESGLSASQGSDFHGPTPWLDLGKNLYMPEQCVPIWQHWNNIKFDESHAS